MITCSQLSRPYDSILQTVRPKLTSTRIWTNSAGGHPRPKTVQRRRHAFNGALYTGVHELRARTSLCTGVHVRRGLVFDATMVCCSYRTVCFPELKNRVHGVQLENTRSYRVTFFLWGRGAGIIHALVNRGAVFLRLALAYWICLSNTVHTSIQNHSDRRPLTLYRTFVLVKRFGMLTNPWEDMMRLFLPALTCKSSEMKISNDFYW